MIRVGGSGRTSNSTRFRSRTRSGGLIKDTMVSYGTSIITDLMSSKPSAVLKGSRNIPYSQGLTSLRGKGCSGKKLQGSKNP